MRMSFFASRRERRLWAWTFAVVGAIYATLGFAQTLAGELRNRGLISDLTWLGLFLMAAAVVVVGFRRRPGIAEIGVALGVAGVYLVAFLRTAMPEQRSHIIEYTIVALLIHEALLERASHGRRVPVPALLAIAATANVGVLDECIQFFLPNRVFDLFDISFNILSAVMAVTASTALRWARRQTDKLRPSNPKPGSPSQSPPNPAQW